MQWLESIQAKQLVAMLFSALVPLLIASLFTYYVTKNIIFDIQLSELEVINKSKTNKIDQFISDLERKIKSLQTNKNLLSAITHLEPTIQNRSLPEYQKSKKSIDQILQVLQRTLQLDDIYLLDKNEKVVYAADVGYAWKYLRKKLDPSLSWKSSKTKYGLSFSAIFLNNTKNSYYSFLLKAPVYNTDGIIYGFVVFEVPMLPIYKITTSLTGLGKSGESFLAQQQKNSNNFMVLSPLRFRKNSINFVKNISIQSNSKYIDFMNYRDHESIGLSEKLPILNLDLFTIMDKKELYHNIVYLRYINYFMAIVTSLIVLIIASILSNSLSRPIKDLLNAIRGVRKKNFNVVISEKLTNAKDEIGILAKSFAEMIFVLKEYYESLVIARNEAELSLKKLKSAQVELVQAEKLASLGTLTAGIAHEINNPMTFVLSTLKPLRSDIEELVSLLNLYKKAADKGMKEKVDALALKNNLSDFDELKDEIGRLLDAISDGAHRTVSIVKDLRVFSRLDEASMKEVDLHENIDAALKLMTRQYINKVEIKKEYGVIPLVECFPGELNQVFMNILANAFQAIRQKGTVTIKTAQAGENVVIRITDNGIGIEKDIIKRIFEPFFTTHDVGKGAGLGLSVCLGIIKAHHGKIDVESEPGKGSTFIITLPIRQL